MTPSSFSSPSTTIPFERIGRMLALAVALLALGVALYRIFTQGVGHDEALMFNMFVRDQLLGPLRGYAANNHILAALVSCVAVRVGGVAEWTLRFPSLLGTVLYVGSLWHLTGKLWGGSLRRSLILGLATLSPLLMEYLVAARGYSLGVGLFMLALTLLITMPWPGTCRRWCVISLLMGLALASIMPFLFALVGVLGGVALATWRWGGLGWKRWLCLLLPGVMVAGLLIAPPIRYARKSDFSIGQPTLKHLAFRMADGTLEPRASMEKEYASPLAVTVLALAFPLVFMGGYLTLTRLWQGKKRGEDGPGLQERAGWFLASGPVFVLVLLFGAHAAAGLSYPEDRTAIYFWPYFCLVLGMLWQAMENWWDGKGRVLGRVLAVALLWVLVVFLVRMPWDYFRPWFYDAHCRTILLKMDERRQALGLRQVSVGGDYLVEPSLNFYRVAWKLDWMKPMQRDGKWNMDLSPHDFVVMGRFDPRRDTLTGWREIYRDEFGTVLLEKKG